MNMKVGGPKADGSFPVPPKPQLTAKEKFVDRFANGVRKIFPNPTDFKQSKPIKATWSKPTAENKLDQFEAHLGPAILKHLGQDLLHHPFLKPVFDGSFGKDVKEKLERYKKMRGSFPPDKTSIAKRMGDGCIPFCIKNKSADANKIDQEDVANRMTAAIKEAMDNMDL